MTATPFTSIGEPRSPFIGAHGPYLCPSEEERGYPKARECLQGYELPRLVREYHEACRDSLGAMFGHNARKNRRLLAEELLARGITEIPDIFGVTEVRP